MQQRAEDGIAMVATLVVMMVATILIATIFAQNVQGLPLARQSQDYQSALQAADSGVEDYINRLDNNATYYLTTSDPTNPALENGTTWTTWAPVPGTNVNEWFRYAVNSSRTAQTGVVYLTVTGAAGQNPTLPQAHYAVRTVKYALSLSGFTSFLYYTDYEIESPNISHLAQSCVLHAWEYNSATGSYGPQIGGYNDCSSELIYFVGATGIQDGLHGPVFSNDELHICGNPAFPSGVTTAYNQSSTLNVNGSTRYGNPGTYYGDGSCTNTPGFGGSGTQPAGAPDSPFPATNTSMLSDIAASNNGGGCAYIGPVHVSLAAVSGTGKMTVSLDGSGSSQSKVDTSHTPSGLTCTGTNVSLPPNGLIYDENGTCGSNCAANVTVQGTLAGQLTIGSQTNVTISGNLLVNNPSGSDILGLSATNSIIISPPTNQTNETIDAAMVALDNSIYVNNWASIPNQGFLNVTGSMAQKYRGPVGTFSTNRYGVASISSGFDKNYVYDSRLRFEQPPYFTSPTLPNWVKSGFTECNATATPAASTC